MFDRDHSGAPILKLNPISSNEIPGSDQLLYAKIHGMKTEVAAGVAHIFKLIVPYTNCYFQGAEILVDIVSVSNFTIEHPQYGVLEQYGFNVNMGKIIYQREAAYAALLPMGLEIVATVTNDTDTQQEMGVNFILHEIRDPA